MSTPAVWATASDTQLCGSDHLCFDKKEVSRRWGHFGLYCNFWRPCMNSGLALGRGKRIANSYRRSKKQSDANEMTGASVASHPSP